MATHKKTPKKPSTEKATTTTKNEEAQQPISALPSVLSRERLEKALEAAGIKVDTLIKGLEDTKKPRRRDRQEPPAGAMDAYARYMKGNLKWADFVGCEGVGKSNAANMFVRCARWSVEGADKEA